MQLTIHENVIRYINDITERSFYLNMDRKNIFFGIVGFISVILGFIAKAFYRPFVSMNHINDLGIAGCLPSFFYVIGFSLLLLLKPNKYGSLLIVVVTFGSLAYELMQSYHNRLLDVKDIVASLVGGVISILIWMTVERKYKNTL